MHGRVLFWLIAGLAILAAAAMIMTPKVIVVDHHRGPEDSAPVLGLKAISSAEAIFQQKDSEGDGTLDYGTLAELSAEELIDPILGSGTKQGYAFGLTCAELTWSATANPVMPGEGLAYFYMDHTGVIRRSTTEPADSTSTPLR